MARGYRNVRWFPGGVSAWRGAGRFTEVSDADFVLLMIEDGAVAVDTRSPEEYAAGHLPGARNVPVSALLADPAGALPDLPQGRDTSLVLLGAGAPSPDLLEAALALEAAGFGRVHVLRPE